MEKAIEVRDLTKIYKGGVIGANNISFSVNKGEIFGFLGPNGAGKSTTIKVLIGLLRPTRGRLFLNGVDIIKHPEQIKRDTGYAAQETAIDDRLTCLENIYLQGHFYHLSRREIKKRSEEVLKMFNLFDRRNSLSDTFSGGMLKRLDIAEALIHRPKILFLDEPTLGLDVQTRQTIWEYIRNLRHQNEMTIFLTTHYMEEADALCDRVAIIDRGEIKAIDTPENLKQQIGGDIITVSFSKVSNGKIQEVLEKVKQISQVRKVNPGKDKVYQIIVNQRGDKIIPEVFSVSQKNEVSINSIRLKRPSLEDVYLHFTGRTIQGEENREKLIKTRIMKRRLRR
ncbi:MAG: ATP-binding cassette domain-containing protein [Candidatus Aerophobetes bacterium]|nr:ATP-binding cassette domain-containing protein [Candidatus Aerophobetes bacterium]